MDSKELVERVAGGEDVKHVLNSKKTGKMQAQPPREIGGNHLVCTNCDAKFKPEADVKNCTNCGHKTVSVVGTDSLLDVPDLIRASTPKVLIPDRLPDVAPEDRQYTLGCLRPGDTFLFESVVPSINVDLSTEYQIVPARRGAVSFSDQRRESYTVPLSTSLLYPVKLTSEDSVDPQSRFYPLDVVRHRVKSWKGVVVARSGMGYYIQPISDEHVTEGSRFWVSASEIRLCEKNRTIRSYIVPNDDSTFTACWGVEEGDQGTFDNLASALRALFSRHKVAFLRLSSWIADDSNNHLEEWIDKDCYDFFRSKDPKFWDRPRVARRFTGAG